MGAGSGLNMPSLLPGLDLAQHGSGNLDPMAAFQAQVRPCTDMSLPT
jgi:hypothetical protein